MLSHKGNTYFAQIAFTLRASQVWNILPLTAQYFESYCYHACSHNYSCMFTFLLLSFPLTCRSSFNILQLLSAKFCMNFLCLHILLYIMFTPPRFQLLQTCMCLHVFYFFYCLFNYLFNIWPRYNRCDLIYSDAKCEEMQKQDEKINTKRPNRKTSCQIHSFAISYQTQTWEKMGCQSNLKILLDPFHGERKRLQRYLGNKCNLSKVVLECQD